MRRLIICGVSAATLCAALGVTTAQAQATKAAAKAPAGAAKGLDAAREADQKAIRQAALGFVNAYNAHDAKAIAALFTPDGEIVDEAGDAQRGRAKIEAVFSAVFDEYPEATMSVDVRSVRFLAANVAEEDGVTSVIHAPGMAAETGRYMALHLKQDGKWLMASARDLSPDDASQGEKLQQLAGLIGDWIDESPDSLIVTSYRWTDNQRFILGEFTIQVAGRPVMNGSQRIGWDPLANVIRSWIFDSEGGFAEGIYAEEGGRWIVKLSGVTRDGEPASATNVITFLDKDRISWQSRDRTIGGQAEPDIEEVVMVRPPPRPE